MRNTKLWDIKLSSFSGIGEGGGVVVRKDGVMKQLFKLTVKM
jgi:hypothetical protein